jgi:hypothetical protein
MAYVNPSNISAVINGKPSAVVEKAELDKLKQVHNEVANGIRSPLAPGFKFWPVSMDPRGRSGPSMAQLHKWVAEHGSTTSRNNGAEEAGEIQSKLVDRFTARVSIEPSPCTYRTLMHAYHDRWLRVRARWEQESGQSAVSALELRFQGSGRV